MATIADRAACYLTIAGRDSLVYGTEVVKHLKARFGDAWCTGVFDPSGGMNIECYPPRNPLTYLDFDIQKWDIVIHCAWVAFHNPYAYGSWILRADSVQTESFVKLDDDEIVEDGVHRASGRFLDFLYTAGISEYF